MNARADRSVPRGHEVALGTESHMTRTFAGARLAVAVIMACPARPLLQVRAEYDMGALGVLQALLRLQQTASVLHTGAHPDDEDSALIARLGRGDHARVAYLSIATRGARTRSVQSSSSRARMGWRRWRGSAIDGTSRRSKRSPIPTFKRIASTPLRSQTSGSSSSRCPACGWDTCSARADDVAAAIKLMCIPASRWLESRRWHLFGVYCLMAAGAVAILHHVGY